MTELERIQSKVLRPERHAGRRVGALGSEDRDPAEAKAEGGQTADNTGLAEAQSTEGLERHAGREEKG